MWYLQKPRLERAQLKKVQLAKRRNTFRPFRRVCLFVFLLKRKVTESTKISNKDTQAFPLLFATRKFCPPHFIDTLSQPIAFLSQRQTMPVSDMPCVCLRNRATLPPRWAETNTYLCSPSLRPHRGLFLYTDIAKFEHALATFCPGQNSP